MLQEPVEQVLQELDELEEPAEPPEPDFGAIFTLPKTWRTFLPLHSGHFTHFLSSVMDAWISNVFLHFSQ